jgi:hypothetical protein
VKDYIVSALPLQSHSPTRPAALLGSGYACRLLKAPTDWASMARLAAESYGWTHDCRSFGRPLILNFSFGDLRTPYLQGTDMSTSGSKEPCPDPQCTWAVHRQDDNGYQFVVQTGLSREEAERLAAEFEAKRHKQMYWVRPD